MTQSTKTYLQDVVIPPGETLLDILEENNMTQVELAMRVGMSEKHLSQIVSGKAPLTLETSLKFEKIFGGSASFWMNLENQYREILARKEEELRIRQEESIARDFQCYAEVANYGYLPKTKKLEEKVVNLQKFFRLDSLHFLPNLLQFTLFRNAKKGMNQYALLAWLRCGEIEAEKIECVEKFDRAKLKEKFSIFRKLTFCQEGFAEKLQKECANCGVRVVYVPYFKGSHINGATRWRGDNPLIQLNTKGAFNDIFWFTFFHELGHIMKHGKKERFLNFGSVGNDEKEIEADKFASNTLINESQFNVFVEAGDYSTGAIERFAALQGVDKGVVAGRLAYARVLHWSQIRSLRKPLKCG